ncbi:MAG: AsmA family protein [Alphaproteobacteria bacterium]|nr:AsmA family protein [Alphaproteobacteria bacterium]
MIKHSFQSVLRKLVGVAAGVLLLLGVTLVAQGFIDTKDYREQIIRTIKERTGKDVVIKGRVTARLLPTPGLFVPGLELRGIDDKDPAPTFTAQAVYISADMLSLFSDQIIVSSITFENSLLEMRRANDGKVHWDWLAQDLLEPMLRSGEPARPMELVFVSGRVFYYNDLSNQALPIRNINLTINTGSQLNLSGGVEIAGHNLRLNAALAPASTPDGLRPLDVRLASRNDEITLKGQLGYVHEKLSISGDFASRIEDLNYWLSMQPSTPAQDASQPLLPIKLAGVWSQDGWAVALKEAAFEGLGSKAAGSISFAWDKAPAFDVRADFSQFQFHDWQSLMLLLAEQRKPDAAAMMRDEFEKPQMALPDQLRLNVNATAETVLMGDKTWQKARLSAEMEDAAITINQLGIQLPGDASLSLFGIISQGASKNLRFEGTMESQGSSLREVMTLLDPNAGDLPEAGFGAFSVRSNLFISPEQVRLSEAEVKLNELNLSGGMVAYFDGKPRIEADVKLRDINFDYFRDVWREGRSSQNKSDYFLRFDKSMNFSWLKKLKTSVDFKVIVDGFTFLDTPGQSAAFRLFAQEGEFGIYNLRFYYPSHTVEASFNLNVKGDVPFFSLVYNDGSDLNTRYFMATPENAADVTGTALDKDVETDIAALKPSQQGGKAWPEELFDMSWMEGYNATFDISLGRLIHRDTVLQRFRMKSVLRDRVLTIQALNFGFWQGRCDITGTLYGGKVPGTSLGFTITNADLAEIIATFSKRNNITGRVGVSGSITTSGVNPLSWVQQADAKLTINGVGVNVSNFNLRGVVDTVAVSRTTADVVTNVNLALPNGSTEFSLEGYLNVKNGLVRTPGITLKSGNMLGNLTGELRLIAWTMNLSTLFQFPAMTSETVPTLSVQLTGSVDDADMTTDTDSLEAYVSKRIIGN